MNYLKIKLFVWRALQFIKFFWFSKSKWRIHSPFVYHLITTVLPKQKSSIGEKIEIKRLEYIKSYEIIEIQDFGAGYDNCKKFFIQKKLSKITLSSARKKKEGELLYRIIKYHKPKRFLELGTNLGFSTAYIATALSEIYNSDYEFISIEGSLNLHIKAIDLLSNLNLKVNLINDTFDNVLNHLSYNQNFDGVFIDGNHTYDATVRYFEVLKKHINPQGFIIFDDIYWNSSMLRAWKYIIKDEKVTLSLDLYNLGIVYFNRNQVKEHFRLWY